MESYIRKASNRRRCLDAGSICSTGFRTSINGLRISKNLTMAKVREGFDMWMFSEELCEGYSTSDGNCFSMVFATPGLRSSVICLGGDLAGLSAILPKTKK